MNVCGLQVFIYSDPRLLVRDGETMRQMKTIEQGGKRLRREFLMTGLLWCTLSGTAFTQVDSAELSAEKLPDAIQAAERQVRPALVRIHVVSTNYRDGRELKYESTGSGVIISKDGYLISNHHVAGHAIRLFCTLSDNERFEAELIGTDPLTDIAVLKLLSQKEREFPAAIFGDSDRIEVGDTVLAMGSPMALSQSVTKGIVSNTKMVMPVFYNGHFGFNLDGENVGTVVRWIGHDAAIFGGNSGGALVDLKGEVIGINEIKFGLGGAIPANLAREVAKQLIEQRRVSRSWIGLEVQPLLKHIDQDQGILVSSVLDDSPAGRAGFVSGDILLALDDKKFAVHYPEQLPLFNQHVTALSVSNDVRALILRDGKEIELTLRPDTWEETRPKTYEFKEWGMTGCNISRVYAIEQALDTRLGVLVTSVRPGGPCGEAKPHIRAGCILRRVGDHTVSSVQDLEEVTEALLDDSEEPVPTLVGYRDNHQDFITVVGIGRQDQDDPGLEAKKAWLPASTQVVTRELAVQFGDPDLTGVRITRVFPDSTAEEAGLLVGDILVAVDDEPILAKYPEDYQLLPTMLRDYRVGTVVAFSVIRAGTHHIVNVELVRAPKEPREMRRYTDTRVEFTARNVSLRDELANNWDNHVTGVLISSVEQGGWAAVGDMANGDLLQSVNGESISSVDKLEETMERLAKEEPDALVVKVLRGVHTAYLEIEPDWKSDLEETEE